MAAGLFRENEGMMENPLLVKPMDPEKFIACWVLSLPACAKLDWLNSNMETAKRIPAFILWKEEIVK